MAIVKEQIFRTFDVRGEYPALIDEQSAFYISRAFVKLCSVKKVLVGYDARLSSPALARAVMSGLASQGAEVIDGGLMSSPSFYFAISSKGYDGGLMITASHMEKQFNGIKMALKGGFGLSKNEVKELKALVLEDNKPVSNISYAPETIDIKDEYLAAIKNLASDAGELDFKIVLDCGNSVAGLYAGEAFRKYAGDTRIIFEQIDGNFPNRGLNPKNKANRVKTVEEVAKENALLGFIFDGDADRVIIIDKNGRPINPSFVGAIIARYLIGEKKGKGVVATITCSRAVRDLVEEAGGIFYKSPVWHMNVKARLRNIVEPAFGVESSGHYIFPQFFNIDDGILTALMFIGAISGRQQKLEKVLERLRNKYYILEEVNFPIESKRGAEEIISRLENEYARDGKIDRTDGLTVEFDDWWFNVRPSLSEPLLRLNIEAVSEQILNEKFHLIEKFISSQ